jgi:hypothetical protein
MIFVAFCFFYALSITDAPPPLSLLIYAPFARVICSFFTLLYVGTFFWLTLNEDVTVELPIAIA